MQSSISKTLLLELIEELAEFETANPHLENPGLGDFMSYMQVKTEGRTASGTPRRHDSGDKVPPGFHFHESTEVVLSRLIGLLYRYTKEYTKKALMHSKLNTVEEFSFLVVLMTYDGLSKAELVRKNVMTKTSGMEVIKRLLKKGLIRQYRDKNDKRSLPVAITDKGLAEMKKVFPQMGVAAQITAGNLTENELRALTFLLQKLESHHNGLYLAYGDEDLEALSKASKAAATEG